MEDAVRITIFGEMGTRYSWMEYNYGYDSEGDFGRIYPHGEWEAPFKHNPAQTVMDHLANADDCPLFVRKEGIYRVTITDRQGNF